MAMNRVVYGIYRNRAQVETAVGKFLASGFRNEDASVLIPENLGTKEFAHEKHTKMPEGTAAGATAGGIVGGTLGLLAGAGALAIPGLGPFIAAGPIMSLLAGAGAGGVVGTLVGALAGVGIPEYEAKRYEGLVKNGGILVSMHCDNSEWVDRAKGLMKQTGAEDISSAGEAGADYARTDKPNPKVRTSGGY